MQTKCDTNAIGPGQGATHSSYYAEWTTVTSPQALHFAPAIFHALCLLSNVVGDSSDMSRHAIGES